MDYDSRAKQGNYSEKWRVDVNRSDETSWMMIFQNSGSDDGLIFLFDVCDSSKKALLSFLVKFLENHVFE